MFFLNAGPFLPQVLKWLVKADQGLFILINSTFTNAVFDRFFPVWRESITWAPLYLFLLLFALFNFGAKAWPWILFILVLVTITDQLSSHVIKEWVGRPRPCRDPEFSQYVRLLMNGCSYSGSFTSSHATNHFGAAVFLSMTLKPYFKKWRLLFYLWAFTISYGQVYVGIHYPLDVICGGIIGSIIGFLSAGLFLRKIGPLTETDIANLVKI